MKKEKKIKRTQTIGEQVANSISHGVMALFGIVAMIFMIIRANNGWELAASIIFGMSIFILYIMSTLYHALSFTKARDLFKRFDHLSIYILIGGTFAPALLLLEPLRNQDFLGMGIIDTGLALFIIQWTLIGIGVVLKSIWVHRFQKLHIVLFLLLGWSAVIFIVDLYSVSIPAFWLMLAGGIAYTIGVVFYSLSKYKYLHFIWHLWVALGTILQFIAIYLYLL